MDSRRLGAVLALSLAIGASPATLAGSEVKLDGYLEYRKGEFLIVDAQRVRTTSGTRFNPGGRAKSVATIPMGYRLRIRGSRQKDGTIRAVEITAERNGSGTIEKQVVASTDQAEKTWVQAKQIVQPGPEGKQVSLGALHDRGPQVVRARRIVDHIVPGYVDPRKVRVYVVDNPEWNAMAMANYSVYVFSGLMADMDDDELAIVLGHELAHATHEHSRRQATKSIISGVAGQVAILGAEQIDSPAARNAAKQAASLGVVTFGNVYSREYEDQADRVGLRYVYEAGYDYKKAPVLWRRFAQKYGDQDAATNFFFGDHSSSAKRASALEREIARNYRHPADLPSRIPTR
ncbi:MAG TPA: M48 family metalloprotease [Candidatus Polarisedimenticolia bacterium]|nr:M48 family metalloprotease [Candidatus Polarisedimenticolia bacterium]